MRRHIQLIFCKIRMIALKATHKNSDVAFIGFSNISRKTILEIGPHSIFFVGKGLHTRAGVVLSVRDNASLKIGNGVFINRNTIISARKSITIEDGVTIGPNVCIYDHDHDVHCAGGGGIFLIMC